MNPKTNSPYGLTNSHKAIYLKYLKVDKQFKLAPKLFEEYLCLLTNELNKVTKKRTSSEWVKALKEWMADVNSSDSQSMYASVEDNSLVDIIRQDESLSEPTPAELSCILDHLEIAGDTPAIWVAITEELDACGPRRSDNYWKKIYQVATSRLKAKILLLDELQKHNIEVQDKTLLMLSNTENRMNELLSKAGQLKIGKDMNIDKTNRCRVCLNHTLNLSFLFETRLYRGDLALVEKLNQCSTITDVTENDGFPQHVCLRCRALIENSYLFKTLSEKSDLELRGKLISKSFRQEQFHCTSSTSPVKDEPAECLMSRNEIINETTTTTQKIEQDDPSEPSNLYSNMEAFEKNVTPIENIIGDSEFDNEEYVLSNEEDVIHENDEDSDEDFTVAVTSKRSTRSTTLKKKNDAYKNYSENKQENEKNSKKRRKGSSNNTKENKRKPPNEPKSVNPILKSKDKVLVDPKPHICTECGKRYTTMFNLKAHFRSHTGEKPYVCETCGKAFKSLAILSVHRPIHANEKKYPCPHCSYGTSAQSNLKVHIKNMHEKLKDHKCDFCDRRFCSRELALSHSVVHTGIKPYKCPACPLAYPWYRSLKNHMRVHHPNVRKPTERSFKITVPISSTVKNESDKNIYIEPEKIMEHNQIYPPQMTDISKVHHSDNSTVQTMTVIQETPVSIHMEHMNEQTETYVQSNEVKQYVMQIPHPYIQNLPYNMI